MSNRANSALGCAILILFGATPIAVSFAIPMIGVGIAVLCLPIILGTWSAGGWDEVFGMLFSCLAILCLTGSGLGYLRGGWGG